MSNYNFNRIITNNKILENNNEWFDTNVSFQSIFYNNIKRISNSFLIKISENFVNIGNNNFANIGKSVNIGGGSYGRVYAGTMYLNTKKINIAVKTVTVATTNDTYIESTVHNTDLFNRQKEEALLSNRMGSLDIGVKVWDSFFYKQKDNNGQIVTYHVLTMERAIKGDVRNYIENVKYSSKQKIDIINKSFRIIKQMIENNVFCYDVKPGNMVVFEDDRVRMIDFDPFFCDQGNTPAYKDLVTRNVTDPNYQRGITSLMIIIPFFINTTNIIRIYREQHPNTQLHQRFRTTYIYIYVKKLCSQENKDVVHLLRKIFGSCENIYNCNLQNIEDFKVVKSFYWYINSNFGILPNIVNGNVTRVNFENGINTNEAFNQLMNQLCPT